MLTVLKLIVALGSVGRLDIGDGQEYKCAIGRSGIIEDKEEGDGGTPIGEFYLKNLYYRKDKVGEPETGLPKIEITKDLGWCDDSKHPDYNRPVTLPFEASHEEMWRDDDLYDLVIELNHNADPVVPGKGSAVFIHVARENYSPTAGCIALKKEDLLELLKHVGEHTKIIIG